MKAVLIMGGMGVRREVSCARTSLPQKRVILGEHEEATRYKVKIDNAWRRVCKSPSGEIYVTYGGRRVKVELPREAL